MYKILGRMAAEYPSIAKPEAQIADRFWGVNITAFKKKGEKIERYGTVMERKSEKDGLVAFNALVETTRPDYILCVFYDGIHAPRRIAEKGDEKVMKMFLDEPWRRIEFGRRQR